jgi:flagellar biosynthetic protein FlhB
MAQQERTEKATGRRRQRARDQGQYAYSQELTSALTIGAAAVATFYSLNSPAGFRAFLSSVLHQATTTNNTDLIRQSGMYFLGATAPIFLAVVIAALAGNFVQGLPIFPSEGGPFKWERLNPVQGLSRLKIQISWIQWLKLVVLVAAISFIAWRTLAGSWDRLVTLPAQPIDSSNSVMRSLTMRLITYITIAVGTLAAADYFIQRWRFEESIKQTKAEVKEDMKALEGNPTIRGKIKSVQRDTARRRMMSRVKDADVIVTNPTHYAVALEYKPDLMDAPRVLAKGRGLIAQRIKELGREYDIPTVENVPLAQALYRLVDIGQVIPMELYKAVAEVLAYVYNARKRFGR